MTDIPPETASGAGKDRLYYLLVWGFDPASERITLGGGRHRYEGWYPLENDPVLFDAGIEIGARVEWTGKGEIRDRIAFRKGGPGGPETEVSCVHLAIAVVPAGGTSIPKNRARIPVAGDIGEFPLPASTSLLPEDHYVALTSYVTAAAEMGMGAMLWGEPADSGEEPVPSPFRFNDLLHEQVLGALSAIDPELAKKVRSPAAFLGIVNPSDRAVLRELENLCGGRAQRAGKDFFDDVAAHGVLYRERDGEVVGISIRHMSLNALPDIINHLSGLEVLRVISCKLQIVPPWIGNLPSLRELDLSENKIQFFPPEIGMLERLELLIMSDNPLKTLPPEIGALTRLEVLNVAGSSLNTLPPEISQLAALRRLNLVRNPFVALPASFGDLPALEELIIGKHEELGVLHSITKLPRLHRLRLGLLPEQDVPTWLREITTLEELDLARNKLKTFPECITTLPNLKRLIMNNNELCVFPQPKKSIFPQLIHLDLRKNKLTELQSLFCCIPKLDYLDLSWNKLQSLPQCIGRLQSLNTLDLSQNKLKSLPGTIGNLFNLEALILDTNALSQLPEEIGHLKSLKKLIIPYNNLSTIPEGIVNLACLEELMANYNKISSLPEK